MRPPLTPWRPFGSGQQRTLRRPYLDAQVLPVAGGAWRWDVRTMHGQIVDIGTRPTCQAARVAATAVLLDALDGGDR
jgi:hypothetical protein